MLLFYMGEKHFNINGINMQNMVTRHGAAIAGSIFTVKTGTEIGNIVVNHMDVVATNSALEESGHQPLGPEEVRDKMDRPSSITKICSWVVDKASGNPTAEASFEKDAIINDKDNVDKGKVDNVGKGKWPFGKWPW